MASAIDKKASDEEISENETFKTIKAIFSSWYDANRCLPMLRVLFRDHVEPPVLKNITLTIKILDQLIKGGHLSSTNLSIICDTIRVTKHFGLQAKLEKLNPIFQGLKEGTITKFTPHRQNLMAFGMILNDANVIRIDGMYNQPLKDYDNAWEMITDLEDEGEIQEGNMESLKEKLRTLGLRLALGKLTKAIEAPRT
ncbi:uncharacterized protein LOC117103228 [Anneissia japonica]|uniref:uncharacterized protein LOC117103228 n=1 Tax=Anneissia japonica TaxID=1529436 RepID=UPI0014256E02|nr:uncharacterized protein LOC117103228 [Anneissia japonica]